MSHAVDQLICINFIGPNEVLSLNSCFLKINQHELYFEYQTKQSLF